MRRVLTHLAAIYLGAGLFGGLMMGQAVPALNWLGIGYYALTWPAQVYCAPDYTRCDPLPNPDGAAWMFTFDTKGE